MQVALKSHEGKRKNKKYALVKYANEASASKAIQEFNNTDLKGFLSVQLELIFMHGL